MVFSLQKRYVTNYSRSCGVVVITFPSEFGVNFVNTEKARGSKPFMSKEYFLQLAAAALPHWARIPPLPSGTRAQVLALLRDKVLTDLGLLKRIVGFL